jgi:YidC/Oxa1 family membrane protein insertase
VAGTKVERQHPTDFDPDDFKAPEFTAEKWRRTPGPARFVATSSSYFSSVLIPIAGPTPFGESQIEERWDITRFPKKTDDPTFGYVYRSRLAYPEQEIAPQASITYKVLSYNGPKERDVLAQVGGGDHGISEVIDLGWFSAIGKILVKYIYFLKELVGSWGWAICLLTITVKMALFPLSIAQIKSSVAMRKLKPEMDLINAKYKDDMAQRGLATQELWRKHGVASPVMGCIPVMLQMPVWFALYTALRTAVELYHTPFGPLIPDLAKPDSYHIIPVVLVVSSFIQQKLMPPQGDPAQQKMMMYMMPAIFGVMMLFLPAGLGVYMLTNTWLGITQQVLVERYLKSRTTTPSGIEVREKKGIVSADALEASDDDSKDSRTALESPPPLGSPPALGKGKTRVRG